MTRVNRKTFELDATGAAPGRIASQIATLLIGKHKTHYVPYRDMGDKVAIKNADKVLFSGKKLVQKDYKHHSMHPGGLKVKPAQTALREDPTFAIYHAVSKMLPRNKFRTDRLRRLSFVK